MLVDKGIKKKLLQEFHGEILSDVVLSNYTSLRIGGKAEYLFTPSNSQGLKKIIELLGGVNKDYIVIGGGTNLLIMDNGVDEVVIHLRNFRGLKVAEESEKGVSVFVRSGTPLKRLMNFCTREGLSGLEGLVGIPGTVGGALFGNSGAYGYEILDTVERVTVLNSGTISVLNKKDIHSAYRNGGLSGFRLPNADCRIKSEMENLKIQISQSTIKNIPIILGAYLLLTRDECGIVRKRMDEFFSLKKETQPIGKRSAGCIFKNPEGDSAGRLIDKAGCRGIRIGDIEVSTVHANFFINRGNGKAEDFLKLIDVVSERVYKVFGIVLEPEIKVIGKR